MSLTEHPITQKIIVAVVSAGMIGVGGLALKARDDTQRHEVQINQILEMKSDVKKMSGDMSSMAKDLAVLQAIQSKEAGREQQR